MLKFMVLDCLALNEIKINNYFSEQGDEYKSNLGFDTDKKQLGNILAESKTSQMCVSQSDLESIVRIIPLHGFGFNNDKTAKNVCIADLEKRGQGGYVLESLKYLLGTPLEITEKINKQLSEWQKPEETLEPDLSFNYFLHPDDKNEVIKYIIKDIKKANLGKLLTLQNGKLSLQLNLLITEHLPAALQILPPKDH